MSIKIKTSSVVQSQAPDFVKSDYPLFLRFLESYYEYMEHKSPPIILDLNVKVPVFTLSQPNIDNYGPSHFSMGELVEQRADINNPGVVTGTGEVFGINLDGDIPTLSLINISGRDKKFIPFTIGMEDPNLSVIRGVETGSTVTCKSEVKSNIAGALNASHSLLDYQNFDTTLDEYMEFIKKEFSPTFPLTLDPDVDARKVFMGLRDFYRSKGTESSYKFLFRALFNEEVDLYFPEKNVLRASGRLRNQFPSEYESQTPQRTSIKLNVIADVISETKQLSSGTIVPISDLKGRTILGKTSGATAVIDNIYKLQYPTRAVIGIEGINVIGGPFHSFEKVTTVNVPGEIDIDNWNILGGVGTAELIDSGTGYSLGQKAIITGGGGTGAEVRVSEIGKVGEIKRLEVTNQGVGYSSEIPINVDLSYSDIHSESSFTTGGVNVSLNEPFRFDDPILMLSPDDKLGRGNTALSALLSSDPWQGNIKDLGDLVPLAGVSRKNSKQFISFDVWLPDFTAWSQAWLSGPLLDFTNVPGRDNVDADGGGGYVIGAPKMLDVSGENKHAVAPRVNSLGYTLNTANLFYGNNHDLSVDSIAGRSSLNIRILDDTVAETTPGIGLQSHDEVSIQRNQTWNFWYKPTSNVATGGRIIARDSGWPDANGFFALSVNTFPAVDATGYWDTANLDFHTRTTSPLDPSTPNYAAHIPDGLHQNEWHMFTITEHYDRFGTLPGETSLYIHYTDSVTPTYVNTFTTITGANSFVADNGEKCAVVLGGISDGVDKNSANVYGGHGAAGLYDEFKFYDRPIIKKVADKLFRNPGEIKSLTGDWFVSLTEDVSNNIFHQAYSLFNEKDAKYNYFTYGTDADHILGESAPTWTTLVNPSKIVTANGHDHGGSVGFENRDSLGLSADEYDLINSTKSINDRAYDPGAKFKITSRSMNASDASTIYHHSFGTQIVKRDSIPGAVPKFGESVLRIVNSANASGSVSGTGQVQNRYSNTTVTIGANHGYHEKSRVTLNTTKDSPWSFPFLSFPNNKRYILSWYYKTSNGHLFDSGVNHLPAASVLSSPTVKFIVSDGHQDTTNQRYAVITKPGATLSSLGVAASNSSYHNWVRDHMILDFASAASVTGGVGDANTSATIVTGTDSASGTLARNNIIEGFIEFSISANDDGSGGRSWNTLVDYYDEVYIDGVQLEEVESTVNFPTTYNIWPRSYPENIFNFVPDTTATSNTKLVVSGPEVHFSYANNIPYDKKALYKISARVNGTAYGTGNISVGVIGIEHADGVGKYVTLGENYDAFSSGVSRYEAPIAQSNMTLNTGGGWTTINAYFQGTQTKNYIPRAYRSFEANNYAFGSVVMSNGLGTNETSTPPYSIFLRGRSTGGIGYANAVIDTTLGYGGTSSLRHYIPTQNPWEPRFVSFANSLAISGTDEYVGSAWGDDDGADWVIKIPKAKRWIFSYYARSNSAAGFPTSTGLSTQLYLRNSDKPEANVALIAGVAPAITVADTWQRFSGVLNFTQSSELDASDHSNWVTVIDTYANSSITSFTSAHALKGSDVNQIILNVGPSASVGGTGLNTDDSGNTVWYDGFMLEEQANTLITTPSEYYSGNWNGPGFGYSNPAPLGEETTHIRPYIAFNQGPGYTGYDTIDLDYVKLEYATNATATLGITGNYIGLGRQVDTTAEISGRQRLYDNNYYQIFSYLIKSGVSVDRYESIVKQLVHPAGMKMFGQVFLESEMDSIWPHSSEFGPGQTAEMFPTNAALLDSNIDGIFGGVAQILRSFFFGPQTISELGGDTLIAGENSSVIWDFNPGDND